MLKKKICFVIIGFGPKKDYESGRTLDLDKTFENLIKPVFDELNIECFRAKEIIHSGIIDVPMYEWIYKADIVVADISTLNPNALYELGVRHALRPYSTIVISEKELKYPFDVNHTIIDSYEHLEQDIGVSESLRFKKILKDKALKILSEKKIDSPVYTYLSGLKPPVFEYEEITKLKDVFIGQPSLSDLIYDGEDLKNKGDYKTAKLLFEAALTYDKNNKFLKQRIVLTTYKSEKPNKKSALLKAQRLLKPLNPETTTDTETLGLSGAINKRLFEITNDIDYLNKAIKFYEKGFYIDDDYYNGVNVAFLYLILANEANDKYETITGYVQSKKTYNKVADICNRLISNKNFNKREDRIWIFQSLSQAYLGTDKMNEYNELLEKIQNLSKGDFDKETFEKQNLSLIEIKKLIDLKISKI